MKNHNGDGVFFLPTSSHKVFVCVCECVRAGNCLKRSLPQVLFYIFMFIFASNRTEDVFHLCATESHRRVARRCRYLSQWWWWWWCLEQKEFTNPMYAHMHKYTLVGIWSNPITVNLPGGDLAIHLKISTSIMSICSWLYHLIWKLKHNYIYMYICVCVFCEA